MQDELRSGPGFPQVHEQVPGLLDDPGLDRVLRSTQDPDAPAAVIDYCKDVHLRATEQVSGEEVPAVNEVKFSVANFATEAVKVYRITRDATQTYYGTLSPQASFNLPTSTGPVWMLADTAGNCLVIFWALHNGYFNVTDLSS